jgi:hypothetical protein
MLDKQILKQFSEVIIGLNIYPYEGRKELNQQEHGVLLQVQKMKPPPTNLTTVGTTVKGM